MELKLKVNSNKGDKATKEDVDKTVEFLLPLITYAKQEMRFTMKGVRVYPDGTKVILKKSD